MKNSYERNRFTILYIIVSAIGLIVFAGVGYALEGAFTHNNIVLLFIVAAILGLLYIILLQFKLQF